MYHKITTNLVVENVDRSVDFYERVLGFRLVMGVPEGSQKIVTARDPAACLSFAAVARDDVELMLQSRKSFLEELPVFKDEPVGRSFTLYVRVASAKELYESIKDKATILQGLHTTFYGAEEFYIRDYDGYVLTFASTR